MSIRSITRRAATGVAGLSAAAAAACVTAGAGGTPQLPPQLLQGTTAEFRRNHVAPAHSSLSVIGSDVLGVDSSRPVLELVSRAWPRMLRPEPRSIVAAPNPSGDIIGVYSGGAFIGGQEVLRTIRAGDVLALYRLSTSEEYSRFGKAHDGGAVEIVWRSPRR